MTLCVVGNSHAASLLNAYKQDPDCTRLGWEFFAAPNGYKNRQGLKAIAFDPAGQALMDFPNYHAATGPSLGIGRYDTFLLTGAHPSPAIFAARLSTAYSPAFREAAVSQICENTNLHRIFRLIREVSAARILLMAKPSFSSSDRAAPSNIDRAEAEIAAFWAKRNVEFLPQLPETLDANNLTKAKCFISTTNEHFKPKIARRVIAQVLRAIDSAPAGS